MLSSRMRGTTRAWTVLVLVFIYAPLALVVVNAFNASKTFAFPPAGFTLQWWRTALASDGMWTSLGNSVVVGLARPRSLSCWAPWPRSRCSVTTSSAVRP